MIKSWIPGIIVGTLLGAIASYGYLSYRYDSDRALARQQLAELKASADQAQQDLMTNNDRLKAAEEMNRQWANRTQSVVSGPANGEAEAQPATTPPERDREAEMRAFSERAVKRGMERWTGTLGLTPDQIARIHQLLQARMQSGQQGNRWNPNLQAELLQVLTPEQKAEYDHIQNRESQARTELRAQVNLSQVQSMFDLNEDQKDQIYQKFATLEQTPYIPAQGENRNQARQAQIQKRVDALQGILTPEQLKQYQKSLDNPGQGGGGWGR